MFKRILLTALLLTTCMTTLAWADGRIWGMITYKNCTPDARDIVCIKPVSGGDCVWTGTVQMQFGPRYNTYPTTIPPGTYYIFVIPWDQSDCTNEGGCVPMKSFYHGTGNDRFDIELCGPTPDPTRPEPGP
jgi:hypothetical protein